MFLFDDVIMDWSSFHVLVALQIFYALNASIRPMHFILYGQGVDKYIQHSTNDIIF